MVIITCFHIITGLVKRLNTLGTLTFIGIRKRRALEAGGDFLFFL